MPEIVADIGSTFTKGCAFDDSGAVMWQGQVPTQPDRIDRTEIELRELAGQDGFDLGTGAILACSSAAGGLRVVALGLTRSFTHGAAVKAALGAGARIVGSFAGALTQSDRQAFIDLRPDVVLLAGGIDAGDESAALAFADQLSQVDGPLAVVVACNRLVAGECVRRLTAAGHEAIVTANVMPQVGQLLLEPARTAIREIFLRSVIGRMSGNRPHGFEVLAPTPAAVLGAAELLWQVAGPRPVLVVDVGGATTDVHSVITTGGQQETLTELMTEPSSRTVEADLGMRESAPAVLPAVQRDPLKSPYPSPAGLEAQLAYRSQHVSLVNDLSDDIDGWLARTVTALAVQRHVGRLAMRQTTSGAQLVPLGRDLRNAGLVLGTGGILSRDRHAAALQDAFAAIGEDRLVPEEAVMAVDDRYLLPCIGVVRMRAPQVAERAMRQLLVRAMGESALIEVMGS